MKIQTVSAGLISFRSTAKQKTAVTGNHQKILSRDKQMFLFLNEAITFALLTWKPMYVEFTRTHRPPHHIPLYICRPGGGGVKCKDMGLEGLGVVTEGGGIVSTGFSILVWCSSLCANRQSLR